MIVRLPRRMNAGNIHPVLAAMFTPNGEPRAGTFEIDFSGLGFIDPVGVVSLANAIEEARARGCEVVLTTPAPSAAAVSYLDDSGFFEFYKGRPLQAGAALRGTTVPIQRVAHSRSHHWLESQFVRWLSARLDMPTAALDSVHTCLKEIFNNIENHSGTDIGCISMQHFPALKEIVIAVSDLGIGIPNAIRRRYPGLSDPDALHHASKHGITSQTTRGNRGVGLNLLIDTVVSTNKGKVHILSGSGKLSCKIVAGQQSRVPWQAPGFCPGTLIELRLKADTFVPDDVERETLEW